MIDSSELNDKNNIGEVLQKDLTKQIIGLIDSEDNLTSDFFSFFDTLKKELREDFILEFIDWITTNKATRYLERRYIGSRNSDNPIFKFHQLEFERAKLEDKLYLEGIRLKDDLKFPATEYWIKRKTWELKQLLPELNNLSKSVDRSNTIMNDYGFPKTLVDNEFNSDLIQSFRIPINSSLENLKINLQPALDDLMNCFDETSSEAFLYNSFEFKDNPTIPTPLKIAYPPNIKIGVFLSKIYKLYEEFDRNYGYEKKEFVKIMILNYKKHRTNFSDINFNLNKHLEAIGKRVKNL